MFRAVEMCRRYIPIMENFVGGKTELTKLITSNEFQDNIRKGLQDQIKWDVLNHQILEEFGMATLSL